MVFLNWLQNNASVLGMVIGRTRAPVGDLLPLEATDEVAVCEGAFFRRAIVVVKAI